jgi:hypothetical protein
MCHKLLVAILVCGLAGASAFAQQVLPPPRPVAPGANAPPTAQGFYSVQFRQPYWRQQEFRSQQEVANFIALQQPNGWEIQVLPPQRNRYPVRYRLMQWGGSRNVADVAEAQRWAGVLEEAGYEPRIVFVTQ